jgi:hypothetical protein
MRKLLIWSGLLASLSLIASYMSSATASAAMHQIDRQVYSGVVINSSGNPVNGIVVRLYVMPRDTGDRGVLVGTATTSAQGHWSLPAPAYSKLPKAAKQAANADMGYLNVEAVASTGSFLALATESAWVGTSAIHTETSSDVPLPMTMRLSAAAGGSRQGKSNCCGQFGCGPPILQKVLRRSHSYTAVGEWHAYWDSSGGVSYTRGATSNIGSYVSMSLGPFTFNGYDQYSTSNSLTMGLPSNGAYNSHEMVISLAYQMARYVMYKIPGNVVCAKWRQIDETGLYDPGHGWFLWKAGKNVINLDGKTRYRQERRQHPRYIDGIKSGAGFTLSHGTGLTYSVGASVFGIGIQAQTNHSTMVAQGYTAGKSHSRTHYVWGNDGNLAANPEVEYSY